MHPKALSATYLFMVLRRERALWAQAPLKALRAQALAGAPLGAGSPDGLNHSVASHGHAMVRGPGGSLRPNGLWNPKGRRERGP